MKKIILPIIVVGIITIFVFFMQNNQEKKATKKQIQEKLILGTLGSYPPFNTVNESGDLVGFDIDLGNAICEQLDIECEFVSHSVEELISKIGNGQIDAIVASVSITEKRKEIFTFTKKYWSNVSSFFAHKDKGFNLSYTVEENKDTLKGKIVGVKKGSVSENFLKDNYANIVEIKSYDTYPDIKSDILEKQIDLIFGNRILINEDLLKKSEEGRNFKVVSPGFTDPKWFGQGVGIALQKGNIKLKERMDEAIDILRENGTYDAIQSRYFDYDIYGEEE